MAGSLCCWAGFVVVSKATSARLGESLNCIEFLGESGIWFGEEAGPAVVRRRTGNWSASWTV